MLNRNAIFLRRFVSILLRCSQIKKYAPHQPNIIIAQLSSETVRRPSTAATTNKQQQPDGFKERPNEIHLKHDYIGPADPQSNIRPIIRHTSAAKETDAEYTLRTKRLAVEQWNQAFWASHNKRFIDVSMVVEYAE